MAGTAGEGGMSSCQLLDLHAVFCPMLLCWVGASPFGTASSTGVGVLFRSRLLSPQSAPLVGHSSSTKGVGSPLTAMRMVGHHPGI